MAKSDKTISKVNGSEKRAPKELKLASINPNESIEVLVRLRRKKSLELALKNSKRYTHEEYIDEFGASNSDIEMVEKFANQNHLSVSSVNHSQRSVLLIGKTKYFESAFKVHLSDYRHSNGNVFRGRTGGIFIPKQLEEIIVGVFGLDNRPIARPMYKVLKHDGLFASRTSEFEGYSSDEVAKVYNFPKNFTGKGQCIGIIELEGGYRNNDLTTYFKTIGITNPKVKSVSIDKGYNDPSTSDSSDGEVVLDIQVAGAVAPAANIVVYFAKNTDKGFLQAITTAIHDSVNKPSVISISWGSSEISWTEQSLKNFNEAFKAASLLGVTICAASGDQGSSDQKKNSRDYDGLLHVDFPASSPYVLACGGTKLNIKKDKIISEEVWNDDDDDATGGGVSDYFDKPDYQASIDVPVSANKKLKGRGVPDIAGNASPNSGYKVLVDGEWSITGGTSAVAPLMAGLIALVNEKNGSKAGFINPKIYADPKKYCRDITTGNNITIHPKKGFTAKKGWDPCTGLGILFNL